MSVGKESVRTVRKESDARKAEEIRMREGLREKIIRKGGQRMRVR
jgi:hypothetical protein